MARAPYLWLLVPALGGIELAGQFFFANRAPEAAAWRALAPTVRELRAEHELVVVAPYWAEPLARNAFGDELMPIRDLARPDVSAYQRALEVSILGDSSPELKDFRLLSERKSGRFRLRLLQNEKPARPAYEFVDHVSPDSVEVFAGDQPCPFNPKALVATGGLHGHIAFPPARFECPGSEFFFVGVTIVDDQDYRPRRCIWAHPTQQGPLRIRYRDARLGRLLYGYAGLSYFLFRDGLGSPVELDVRIDSRSIGRYVHHDELGWNHFEFQTGRAEAERGSVEFEIRSQSVTDRHFCFYADLR